MEQSDKRQIQRPGRFGRAVSTAFRRFNPARNSRAEITTDGSETQDSDFKGPLGLNLLCDVSEPEVDFIFVHGLGGGSRKTWSLTSDPQHYWPKEWLPQDPEFRHVRLHSFGYKADWAEAGESLLNIRDFARFLISEINSNPGIQRTKTKIVLIAHSMGGIVIKKAFMLAHEDSEMNELSSRFHTFYFLATPHRGSDLAGTLKSMLKVSFSSKPFLEEIDLNSESIMSINDSFRHVAKDLHLWSFYETLKSTIANIPVLIVDQSSAILGYGGEQPVPLLANHRGISKFEGLEDKNYKTLRNHFVKTLDKIGSEVGHTVLVRSKLRHTKLVELTGVSARPIDDLSTLEENRAPGSCQWLPSKPSYCTWRNSLTGHQPIFWLIGKAGFGKSILTGSVLNEYHINGLKYSYFFFKRGIVTKSTIASCLLSLAYQMAATDDQILEKLVEIQQLNSFSERWNEMSIWREIFVGCIFKLPRLRLHWWVIDSLDECQKFQQFVNLLLEAPSELKIFITSRRTQQTEAGMKTLISRATYQEIQPEDTVDDFRILIQSKMDQIPVSDGEAQQKLERVILSKASGSFLWVSLVLQRLVEAFSEEEVEEILKEVPNDMNELYQKMLSNLVKTPRASKLARCTFSWALFSRRPLLIEEMQVAIKLDLNETVSNLGKTITAMCGQLVYINQKREIEFIHQTANTFLLQQQNHPDLIIDKRQSHNRISQICLNILLSSLSKDSLLPTTQFKSPKADQEIALSDYACEYFSDHLKKSSPNDEITWNLFCNVLRTTILSWIEYVGRKQDLALIPKTAKNLRIYLKGRVQITSLLDPDVAFVSKWIFDLAKLNGKFGAHLVAAPTTIHTLIPALCPSDSLISKTRSSRRAALQVKGYLNENWDDCLARVDFLTQKTTCIAYGDWCSCVGLSDGKVHVYFRDVAHEENILDHGERTNLLAFGAQDRLLASSGPRTIKVWNTRERTLLWTFEAQYQALDLQFLANNSRLSAAMKGNYIINWNLKEGVEIDRWSWIDSIHRATGEQIPSQQPGKASFSYNCSSIAVSYRGLPIYLFDIKYEKFIGCCRRESSNQNTSATKEYPVDALAFNPNPGMNVLVVSYGDGELMLYDVELVKACYRKVEVYAHCMATSPDGRILATGSSRGTIKVFEFGTLSGQILSLIYCINAFEEGIRGMAFSNDSLRFADIRGSQYRVWEPDLLVSNHLEGGSQKGIGEAVALEPRFVSMLEGPAEAEITAICSHPTGSIVFAGKRDGAVVCFETQRGSEVRLLYRHALKTSITTTSFARHANILATADEAGRVLINKISISETDCQFGDHLADIRFEGSVTHLLLNASGSNILIQGEKSAAVFTVTGDRIGSLPFNDSNGTDKAINHPLQPENFIVIRQESMSIYSWSDAQLQLNLQENSSLPSSDQSWNFDQGSETSTSTQDRSAHLIATLRKRNTTSPLQIWHPSNLINPIPIVNLALYASKIIQIIALTSTTMLFLDTSLWICSLDVSKYSSFAEGARRHFFILSEWQGIDGRFLIDYLSGGREFVVVRKGGILVIGMGLEFEEAWVDNDL